MKTQTFIRTFVLTIFMSAAVSLQAAEVTVPQEEVYPIISVDEQPTIEHDGKSLKFSDYLKNLSSGLKVPEGGQPGRVICNITISSKGDIADVVIKRGVDEITNAAAVAKIKSLGKINPAMYKGKHVAVSVMVPLIFK